MESAHAYYIRTRGRRGHFVSLSVTRCSMVLEFCELPLLTIPPSKVRLQCKPIRQKVCKSCEHVFRAKRRSEHTPINYYWRMRYIYFRTRACIWYSCMRPIYTQTGKKAPRVPHFSAFHYTRQYAYADKCVRVRGSIRKFGKDKISE